MGTAGGTHHVAVVTRCAISRRVGGPVRRSQAGAFGPFGFNAEFEDDRAGNGWGPRAALDAERRFSGLPRGGLDSAAASLSRKLALGSTAGSTFTGSGLLDKSISACLPAAETAFFVFSFFPFLSLFSFLSPLLLAASGFAFSGLLAGAAFVFASFAALGGIPRRLLAAKKCTQSRCAVRGDRSPNRANFGSKVSPAVSQASKQASILSAHPFLLRWLQAWGIRLRLFRYLMSPRCVVSNNLPGKIVAWKLASISQSVSSRSPRALHSASQRTAPLPSVNTTVLSTVARSGYRATDSISRYGEVGLSQHAG